MIWFDSSQIKNQKDPNRSLHAGVGRGESCAAGARHVHLISRARLSTRVTAQPRDLRVPGEPMSRMRSSIQSTHAPEDEVMAT
jgi:hypothetical protein